MEAENVGTPKTAPGSYKRLDHNVFYQWWRTKIVGSVDHAGVARHILEESRWSPRYAFMTMMSAGIAMLGLLLSSPTVVIGAMLISPLMSPILGLGFGVAEFNFIEMRHSLLSLAAGAVIAVAFSAAIVLTSPLQEATTEILSRTRPNLFDLLVALFAALAGTFAIIRGRGDTIVGVAIATALMPPLAVVGFGLATWNMAVLGGSAALFVTNLLTITLAATIMARVYGFGHSLSETQSWTQKVILMLVFVAMAIPLGIALRQIASETLAEHEVRSFLIDQFGGKGRITQLAFDFDIKPTVIRAVVITPRARAIDNQRVEAGLAKELGRPIKLQLDEVLVDPLTDSLESQRAHLTRVPDNDVASAAATQVARLVGLAAGVAPDAVTIDRQHRRASVSASPAPGATAQTYRTLEARVAGQSGGWQIRIVPPQEALPTIRFARKSAMLDPVQREAVLLAAWEVRRWNIPALAVPGLAPDQPDEARMSLAQQRGGAVAAILRQQAIPLVPTRAEGGRKLTLTATAAQAAP